MTRKTENASYFEQLHLLMLAKQELARFFPINSMLPSMLDKATRMPVLLAAILTSEYTILGIFVSEVDGRPRIRHGES